MLDNSFDSSNIESSKTKSLRVAYKCYTNLLLKKKFFKVWKKVWVIWDILFKYLKADGLILANITTVSSNNKISITIFFKFIIQNKV